MEDLKLNQDISNSIIFTQFLKEKTFVELEEKEKICLLEELLNNSTNSNSILNLIQYKFQTGYYLKDEESYAYLKKKKSFPSDSKIPLNQEVHHELWRNNISCNNDQIIQKSIISNTEYCSDLFIQDFLLNIFNHNNKIVTMPLIESMKDLEHSETIIHEYILYKIENFFTKTIKAKIKQYGKSNLQELLAIPDISGIKSLLKEGPDHFIKRRSASPELDQYLKQIKMRAW